MKQITRRRSQVSCQAKPHSEVQTYVWWISQVCADTMLARLMQREHLGLLSHAATYLHSCKSPPLPRYMTKSIIRGDADGVLSHTCDHNHRAVIVSISWILATHRELMQGYRPAGRMLANLNRIVAGHLDVPYQSGSRWHNIRKK